jgi:nitrogen fixation protein NifU and related proteins
VVEKNREIYSPASRDGYSSITSEHMTHPRNAGKLADASGYGEATLVCGDTLMVWLKIDCGRVIAASFMTDNGCATTIAAGSMVTEMVKGKTVAQAARIRPQHILAALGGSSEESLHGSLLAGYALHEAVQDYMKYKNEPWKRAYGRP